MPRLEARGGMDEVERITVSLPLTDELRGAVADGEFPTTDAAVAAAVEAWTADRMVDRLGVERLRRYWNEGLASGDPKPLDAEELIRRALNRAEVMQREGVVGR